MFFRDLLLNPSQGTDGIGLNKANYSKVMNQYLCMVKQLICLKIHFLGLLQSYFNSPSLALKKDGSYWVAKAFDLHYQEKPHDC